MCGRSCTSRERCRIIMNCTDVEAIVLTVITARWRGGCYRLRAYNDRGRRQRNDRAIGTRDRRALSRHNAVCCREGTAGCEQQPTSDQAAIRLRWLLSCAANNRLQKLSAFPERGASQALTADKSLTGVPANASATEWSVSPKALPAAASVGGNCFDENARLPYDRPTVRGPRRWYSSGNAASPLRLFRAPMPDA